MKTRVEFKLSMPGRNSWNGKWSGSSNNYVVYKTLPADKVEELSKTGGYWSYSFGDGWTAGVTMRVLPKGERKIKSSGFCGYDWMVGSIISKGRITTIKD